MLTLSFETEIIEWRGPSPYFYAPIPAEHVDDVRRAAKVASYGWGVVPVDAMIAEVRFTTSLFPKDGGYLLPLKDAVRKRLNVTVGDSIAVMLRIGAR